ncbi:nuclease-related domain-containing protein [Oryzihumus leptocrescens]|uniref:nuclease-related domain-containing protein n=1 Tax=Oryzihumus leptocrescens TaxID=297536 RepID=UPI002482C1A3|nr:nuclease-related domain-containing protein [Oryzihumus leptocrescens]
MRFAAAFTREPQSTTAWATGAVGEEVVARPLTVLAERGVLALHDRRIPGRRSNIDHIVVSTAGALVVDTKRYQGATVRTGRVGGIFTPRRDELLVRGRLGSKLIDGLDKQVDAVRSVLVAGGFADVPVGRALCFVDADFPWFTRIMRVGDTCVVNPRGLLDLVTRPGPLVSDDQWYAVSCQLGERLRSMD